MKKRKMKLLMLLACALFLSSSAFAEDIGKFTSLEGRVDVFKMGQGEAISAAEDQAISVGDVVRTKKASKAEITFADNTIIRLADDTRVEIKEYQVDQKKKRINAIINVDRGKIRAIVSKANGKADFTINTPNASGNVKGTDVVVFYQKSSTGVVVVDGKFSTFNLSHPDKVITVSSGNTSVIPPDEPPQEPRKYLAMEMERHEADTKVVAKRKEDVKAEGYAEPGQMGATVIKVAGSVLIRSRDAISWHDAKINEILGAGDEIETKEDGKIEIKLENGNVINLKPNTKLKLQKLTQDLQTGDYENLLESNIGKIRAQVEKIKGNSKFEIKTPTAVAAVKGTILYLNILPNLTSAYFEGGNGTLNNIISGITRVVGDGNSSSADDQGDISDPSPPSDEERSEWTEGWEAEGGGEGYSPPGGGEGEGTEEEAGGGAPDTGAGGGDTSPFDDVPITETSLPPTGEEPGEEGGEEELPPVTNLSGTASGNFGSFSSFNVDGESFFNATFTATTTVAPWSGTAPTTATGTYSNPNLQSLWWGDVTGTGDDGGTFEGWTGGSWHSWEGVVSSIYIDPSGMAGNLFGYMSGTNADGTLSGSGDLFVIPMAENIGILPADLSESIDDSGSGFGNLYVSFNDGVGYLDSEFDRQMMKIEGENWGIWREIYSAEYDNPNGLANWIGAAGGNYNEGGYFFSAIEGIDNLTDALRMDVIGAYLDYYKLGAYYGTILGTYTPTPWDSYYFEGIGLGGFVEEPLTFSGYWGEENTSLYNDSGYGNIEWIGEEYGLIGSTVEEWWAAESFPILAMGEYYIDDGEAEEPFLWNTQINSYNAIEVNSTTLDGGAFWGYTGGIWNSQIMDGAVAALYIDPSGNAGILRGNVSGNYYPGIEMWMAEGILTPTQMAQDLGISPEDLYYYKAIDSGYLDAYIEGDFLGNGNIYGEYDYGDTYFIVDDDGNSQNWGIYDLKIGWGNEYDNPYGSKLWTGIIEGGGVFGYNNSQGVMSGDLFGVYYDESGEGEGSWIATSIGEWRGYYIEDGLSEDDGEYYGFIGGLWDNEAIIGKIVALYSQPYGAIIDYNGAPFSGSDLAGFDDIGNLSVDNVDGIDPDLGQPWGIWKFDVSGGYNADMSPAPFKLTVGGGPNEEGYWLGIIAGIEKPESDIILGAFRGIWLDAEEIHGGLYRGDVFGSTDTDTWEGMGLGEWQTQAWEGDFIPPSSLTDFITNYIDSEPIIGLGTGNFQGGGSSGTFDVNGDNFSLDEQNWGIYYLSLGGEYNNPDIRKIWSGVVGGNDIDETGEAYWLVHTSGIWEDNEIRGIARGTVLSDANLGSIEGDIFGLYNESGVGSGTWDAIAVGSWNEEPLKFVSNVENFYNDAEYGAFFNFSFDDNGAPVFEEIGTIDGLLGSTQSLWTGSASTVFMGEYSLVDESPSHLWGADVYSYNYENNTYTTYDGGAYYGTILGIHQNPIEGMLIAFYIDPDGNAGYISGNLDGETYSELGMFEMDGTLTTKQMAEDVGILPDELFDVEIDEGLIVGSGLGNFEGGGTIDGALGGVILSLAEQDWGIWMAVSAGEWSGPTSPWNLALGGVSLDEIAEVDGYWLGTAKGADWLNGILAGEFRGVFFGPEFDGEDELTSFSAGSITGNVIGTYDEVDTTWQAVSAGEWVELAQLDFGIEADNLLFNDALAAMVEVPITETYASLLQGTGTFDVVGGGTLTGAMDISFYTSASAIDNIWAALISGNYTGPTSDSWTLPLIDGAGTSATLTGTEWDNGQWLANVTDGVAPNGVTFDGQAGGTFTGTDSGTFTGVGAGTWTTP